MKRIETNRKRILQQLISVLKPGQSSAQIVDHAQSLKGKIQFFVAADVAGGVAAGQIIRDDYRVGYAGGRIRINRHRRAQLNSIALAKHP